MNYQFDKIVQYRRKRKGTNGNVFPVHAIKAYRRSGGLAPLIFNLGTKWRWLVNFHAPAALLPGIIPGSHWVGGWTGPTAGLDVSEKRKISYAFRDFNCGRMKRFLCRYRIACRASSLLIITLIQ